MPLIASKGVRQTPWSEGQAVRQLEPMGFIKFDILGLATLRMMEEYHRANSPKASRSRESPTFSEDVKKYYDENLHPDVINLNDQSKFIQEHLSQAGKWMGIFQFTERWRTKPRKKSTAIIDHRLYLRLLVNLSAWSPFCWC